MGKKSNSLSSKQFIAELAAFAEEQRNLIETACAAFPVDAAARDVRVSRVQNSFQFFVQTYFPHYIKAEPSVFHQWVFDQLPKKLDAAVGQKVDVSAPRGEAKSTLVTQLLPLWCVVTKRKRFIPIIMDALDQAQSMLEAIKVELESNPRLQMDFPDACGAGRVWNVGVLLTKTNVKIQAFGSGKRMRGLRHGPYRPDLVILDDIENDENVMSKEQRDKLEKWLNRTVLPLGPPDGSMDIIYLNTILHYDSVANRTHKNVRWTSVKFKAIIEYPARLDLWQQWEEVYINDGETAADVFYTLRRTEMDAGAIVSWPSMRPLLMLMKIRAADHASFDAEYQNDPDNDENAPFKVIEFWVQPSRDWVFFGAHDPSMGKKNKRRDPCAILVGGLDRNHGVLDVVEARIARMVPSLQTMTLIELQREYNCLVWGIESVQFQEFFKDEIVKESRKAGVPIPARGIVPGTDKDLRILSMQPHIANGTVRSHQRHTVLNSQLRHYPEADHDDGPDALQMLFMLAFSTFTGTVPRIITGPRKHYGTRH
ncbi:phage terminase large subunit [Collimonas antrihumi]|uniref:phage terminase large subunit n=1 Tax=Collimonas antrihumi TaxID=1940615 RepID=UPI001B8CC92F|nr:phage terminase large subunit [Collimonas antrihumi]